jgi:hypothetical protein
MFQLSALSMAFKNTPAFLIIIPVLLIGPEGLSGTEFKERVELRIEFSPCGPVAVRL